MRDHTHPAAAFHAVALVAAARAALGVARSVADRRAGRDPSAQEPEGSVRADLVDLRESLAEIVVRLRLRAVVGVPEGRAAALAQSFEDRLLVDDLAGVARRVHQKLLSLYPAVDEAVVEEAREIAHAAAILSVGDDVGAGLGGLARRSARWADVLADALA